MQLLVECDQSAIKRPIEERMECNPVPRIGAPFDIRPPRDDMARNDQFRNRQPRERASALITGEYRPPKKPLHTPRANCLFQLRRPIGDDDARVLDCFRFALRSKSAPRFVDGIVVTGCGRQSLPGVFSFRSHRFRMRRKFFPQFPIRLTHIPKSRNTSFAMKWIKAGEIAGLVNNRTWRSPDQPGDLSHARVARVKPAKPFVAIEPKRHEQFVARPKGIWGHGSSLRRQDSTWVYSAMANK
ncbi:MAG: hypothetical protein ACT4QC_08325 [Planctomycetaceae bacterium]